MGDLIEILRQKAAGQRNKVGDLWADWVCERAADELARLRAEVEGLREQHGRDSRELRELCAARDDARRERDELRRRIAEAPAFTLTWVDGREWRSHDVPDVAHADISGQRVALVRLDAEEGK